MVDATLTCPACGLSFDAAAAFSNSICCQPAGEYWEHFAFKCPRCGDHSELRVEGDFVLIGGPDGFPEPSFREHARALAPEPILVSWAKDGAAVVTMGNRQWCFRPAYYRQ